MNGERTVVREQLWVGPPGRRCLVVTDRPAAGDVLGTVCLAHGLTGDRAGPQDLLARLSARLCARLGVRVVRFDMTGSGDSECDFAATRFSGMAGDFVRVARATCPAGEPLVCAGISIGGVPAVMAAHELGLLDDGPRPAGVLLLSSDLIQGVRFATDGVTAIRGGEFHLPAAFFRERETIRPRDLLLATGLPFLLCYGTQDAKLAREATWFTGHGGTVRAVDSDHLFESSAARRVLADACARFLVSTFSSFLSTSDVREDAQ
ncbi:putative redox protein [Actinacidiphila yanglinensis]|uniref:Putative redox protein n=1 Tax=Actinacidiphila yanglinensis TaxID=310779 RepID=A0A1H6EAJ0_9ACTN|nr:alpha/beta fold hydrolase [Actinacidiphila yanglinensis]SEG94243.1 putative redox protein [Actinacidiphila yanglinensis]